MKRNIIITGGGLVNKGAQAMTFITVSELTKKFPSHRILLLSPTDLQRPVNERECYTFDFIGWYPQKFAKCQKNPLLRLICRLKNGAELAQAEQIYKNTDLMVDISGYAIGSNWTEKVCNDYLDSFEFAHAFDIPVYVMPQSFGPFDFKGEAGQHIDKRIRQLFPKIKVVCAREKEGFDAMTTIYGLNNVQLLPDLVLNSKSVDLKSIFKYEQALVVPDVNEAAVAVIPNSRNIEVGDANEVYAKYKLMIDHILKTGRNVYILKHSGLDTNICKNLKALFADNDKVVLLKQEMNCLEFNEFVKKMDFLIASRFHSIVHAYKNGIPCIALGWAVKYHDLLSMFGQEQYMFDVRNAESTEQICAAIELMNNNYKNESQSILNSLSNIQKNNVFDVIKQIKV